jgi:hypothetical protein
LDYEGGFLMLVEGSFVGPCIDSESGKGGDTRKKRTSGESSTTVTVERVW